MACSGDVQVVPDYGAEVGQPVSVEAVPEPVMEVQKPDVEATATTKEESMKTTVMQDDTAPEPDQQDDAAPAPEQAASEVSASDEQRTEEEKPPVAKEEEAGEHTKAPDEDDHHQESTRERLKRHRQEVAGRVWVPEKWGQEKLLKDWVDCAVFDRPLVAAGLLTARRALVAESCTRRRPADHRTSTTTTVSSAGSSPLRVQNGCS
ncbi:hypothetical protein QOZ80_4BG0349980 [Eleusine coracana subsp. coracana]|nr:hypothetical protein QOZ80_4BG0349980 [Eleusine coracana subsp. coracana]